MPFVPVAGSNGSLLVRPALCLAEGAPPLFVSVAIDAARGTVFVGVEGVEEKAKLRLVRSIAEFALALDRTIIDFSAELLVSNGVGL